jgi:hypothetical protein
VTSCCKIALLNKNCFPIGVQVENVPAAIYDDHLSTIKRYQFAITNVEHVGVYTASMST